MNLRDQFVAFRSSIKLVKVSMQPIIPNRRRVPAGAKGELCSGDWQFNLHTEKVKGNLLC